MAKTFTAPFVQTYKTYSAVATAALGGLGTSTVTGAVLLATAGLNGSLVSKLTVVPRATVTATSLVLFLVKANAPTVYLLIDSELMAAQTLSTTTVIAETVFGNIAPTTPMRLEAGDMLYVGTQVALAAGIVFYSEVNDL